MRIIKNKLTYGPVHDVYFPKAPEPFRRQAELLAEGLKYLHLDGYSNLAELDQVLTVFFAKRYSELAAPEHITAARKWMVQQGIMELKPGMVQAEA